MKRIVIVQKVIQKSDGPLTPIVTRLFKKIKEAKSKCTVDWNGSDLFQVKGPYQDLCVVNLTQKTCSCRKLEISSILCKHAIAAIHDMADNGMDVGIPEDLVHDSSTDWETTQKRKKSKGEIAIVKGDKLTRKGKTVTCSNCQGIGHNKRDCKATGSSDGRQSEPVGSQVGPSEPMARKYVARKSVARKPVTRKRVATKPVTRKRAVSEIIQAAQGSQNATQGSQAAIEASRAPTSPTIKRTKMSA
ncbi:mutator type transposase [Tanacetum coccineum]